MAVNMVLRVLRASDEYTYFTAYAGTRDNMSFDEKRHILENIDGWDNVNLTVETAPALFEDGSYLVSSEIGETEIKITTVWESSNVVSHIDRLRTRLRDRRKLTLELTRLEHPGSGGFRVERYTPCIIKSIDEFKILGNGSYANSAIARTTFTVLCFSGMRQGEGDDF